MDAATQPTSNPAAAAEPGTAEPRDSRTLYAIWLSLGIVLIAVGGVGYVVATQNKDDKPEADIFNAEAGPARETQRASGVFQIDPETATLTRGVDGSITGQFVVTAANQPFMITRLAVENIQGINLSSTCPIIDLSGQPKTINAGQRCPVILTYDPAAPGAGLTGTPIVKIETTTRSPGGSDFIGNYQVNIAIDPALGIGPATTPDMSGIGNNNIPIDGPAANAAGFPSAPYQDPTPSYPSAPPSQPVYGGDFAGPPQLSPRELLLQARRQPALSQNIQVSPAVIARANMKENPRSTANWNNLDVPRSTSSMPVDMTRVVTMDRIITAVLTRPIDSRAPTQIVAQVDRNVYGAEGRSILIPRGSMIIGTPATGGDGERMAISWTQIIRPDGARFVFKAASADANGAGGVPGLVNQQNKKRYGAILMGTALTAAIAAVGNAQQQAVIGAGGTAVGQNTGGIVTDIVRQDLQTIIGDIVQRNQQVQTIVTVPAGTRVTIVPTQDLHMAAAGGYEAPMPRRQSNANTAPQTNNQPQGGLETFPSANQNTGGGLNPYASMYEDPGSQEALTSPSPRPIQSAPPEAPYPLREQTIQPSSAVPSWVNPQGMKIQRPNGQ